MQWEPAEAVHAVADAVSLEQVLHNLVRNAAEAMVASEAMAQPATATGGARGPVASSAAVSVQGLEAEPAPRVRLVANHNDRVVTIVVQDNGPGMPADQLEQIFTPFYTTKEGGMGLGLPLCERLMDAMGGRIEADSVVGQGTRFTLTLKAVA